MHRFDNENLSDVFLRDIQYNGSRDNTMKKRRIYHIPIFVPHYGCPHDCVFCNQKKITGCTDGASAEDAKKTIDSYLESIGNMDNDAYIEVAFFGGSFTGIEKEQIESLMSLAFDYKMNNKIHGIRCSTRPDYINEDILKLLKKYGITVIELGVQSADEDVLSASNRGHSFEDVKNASNLIKANGIGLGLQMMLGLPLDTKEKSIKTAEEIIKLSPDCVRIYPTLVLEGTHLYNMYKDGKYSCFSLSDTVELTSELLKMFCRNNIEVIRVGLQTTDNINSNTVIGPYHPAIRELCLSYLIKNIFQNNIDFLKKNPTVYVPSNLVSPAIGHKGENKKFLEKQSINLKVLIDDALMGNHIKFGENIFDIYA